MRAGHAHARAWFSSSTTKRPLLLPTHAHNPRTNRSTHQRGGSSPDFFQLFTSSSPHCHNGRSCFDSVTDKITKWGISVKPYKTGFRGRNCIFYCLQTPGASGQNKTGCEKISQPVFVLFFASKYTAKCSHPSGPQRPIHFVILSPSGEHRGIALRFYTRILIFTWPHVMR